MSNYRIQAHSFGIFCWPGCFRTTFDSAFRCFRTAVDSFFDVSLLLLLLSLSPVIAVMSCRSPGVLVFQYQVGNEVFWERLFSDAPML